MVSKIPTFIGGSSNDSADAAPVVENLVKLGYLIWTGAESGI